MDMNDQGRRTKRVRLTRLAIGLTTSVLGASVLLWASIHLGDARFLILVYAVIVLGALLMFLGKGRCK